MQGGVKSLSTLTTLADSLPTLEAAIAELSLSTSLWERHVAKKLEALALPRARALAKRDARRSRKTVDGLSAWAYSSGGAQTVATMQHEGAYAGRTRGKRPVSYDVEAALDKLMGMK
jgi:hypothetical protein